MISVLEDTTALDALDFEPACEATFHRACQWGCSEDAPAAFLFIAPCGLSKMMCAGWVATCSRYPQVRCCACDGTHLWDGCLVLPL